MDTHRRPIVVFLLSIFCCSELPAQEKEWAAEMSRGYANDAEDPLLDFLSDWHAKSQPISPEELKKKPEFERAVYGLYRLFFKPPELYYKNAQYIVIQDEIDVRIVDSDLARVFDAKTWDRRSLVRKQSTISHVVCKGFRPHIEIEGKNTLYLENDRLAVMLEFLTGETQYRMNDRLGDESRGGEDRRKKLQYLNSAMKVFAGHWGSGWHFETFPYIRSLYLSSDFKRAVILYRGSFNGGGEALMHRQDDGNWEIISMDLTWME